MEEAYPFHRRAQSAREELANSISHGLGLLAALLAALVLVSSAVREGDTARIVGASTFGATMVLLYLCSTLYHAWPNNKNKRTFQMLDHMAIYLLIAGTYTPFTLGVLSGVWGWTLFGVVWTLAIIGIVLKGLYGVRHRTLSTGMYLAMSWIAIFAAGPFSRLMHAEGLFWLLGGGIVYTVGVIFFALDDRVRYSHFVWHLFVIAGTACHFVAVFFYAH